MLYKTLLVASALVASVLASPMPKADAQPAAVAEAQPNAVANSDFNNQHRNEVFYENHWYTRETLVVFIERTFDSRRCHRRGEYSYRNRCETVEVIVVAIFNQYGGNHGGHSKREALPEANTDFSNGQGGQFGGSGGEFGGQGKSRGNSQGNDRGDNRGSISNNRGRFHYKNNYFNSESEIFVFIESSFSRCGSSESYNFEGSCRSINTIVILITEGRY